MRANDRSVRLHRLPVTAPLAVIVALLVHTAEFGSSHAFGGPHGAALITAALAALALTLVGIPLAPLFGLNPFPQSKRTPYRLVAAMGLDLFVGSTTTYLGLETLEGHPGLTSGVAAALALCACITAIFALATARGLTRIGHALATSLPYTHHAHPRITFLTRQTQTPFHAYCIHHTHHGRAPPTHA
jgi:hypothetical protein